MANQNKMRALATSDQEIWDAYRQHPANSSGLSTKRSKNSNSVLWTVIIFVTACIFLYIGTVIGYNIHGQKYAVTAPASAANDIESNANAQRLADELQIDVSRLNITYAQELSNAGWNAEYIYPNTIRIKEGLTKQEALSGLAHEYYHFIFYTQFNDQDEKNLNSSLSILRARDTYFNERVDSYESDGCAKDCIVGEMHAISCTELPRYVLTIEYNQWCDSYVPNRDSFLPM